jgi:RNA-directed DNA polymerase
MRAEEAEAHASAASTGKGGRNLPGTAAGAEARTAAGGGTKPEVLRLMEAAVERSNMLGAYERVVKNQGAPGVDGLTVTEFKPWLQAHWPDERVLKLIRRSLEAGMMEGGVTSARTEGTPQGGPLSPLLSNILLTDLDRELERRGHRFCRYADDCNIVCRKPAERAAGDGRDHCVSGTKAETQGECQQERSGTTVAAEIFGLQCHVAPETEAENRTVSRQRLTEKIRQTLRGAQGQSVKQVIAQLNPLLRGWVAYFRLTEEQGVLEELDGWTRRKVRALLWRHWKRGYTRAQNLKRAGLSHERAWQSATNGRGPWWNGGSSHMNAAYPKSWFDRMQLVSLLDTQRRFSLVS